ncbi:ATP-dependent helicase [Leisingera sp. XS_AS12]|uniref:ATP-dependent helicase n=1 Tax=Leisingera sp. XS_AS12 TaxID=3241294 RepID=UPI003514FFB5
MSNDAIEYLRSLSDEQSAAALKTDDPVMIIACAGSGKTRTLIGRFIHLMMPQSMGGLGADPNSIMMVTFTNKAAKEMRERIKPIIGALQAMNPRITGEPWIGTFHGLSLRILRVEAAKAGLGRNFSIFDESDAAGLAKEVAEQLDLDSFDVDEFFRDLETAKARLLSADLLSKKVFDIHMSKLDSPVLPKNLATWEKILGTFHTQDFPRVYTAYQSALDEQNAVDFSDLMNRVTKLFQENEEVRNSWRSTFRHFMVDEVQDTNRAQVAWLDALTDGGREMVMPEGADENAFANAGDGMHEVNGFRIRQFPRPTVAFVGDDDQSIYAFRGSDPSIMRLLTDRYPGLDVKFMRQSYRCQPAILDVANTLVRNNAGRYDKVIKAADETRPRAPVYVEEHQRPEDEIRRLAAEAQNHIASGEDPSQFAILTRTRDLAKAVAKELRAAGLPVTEGKASDIRKTAEVRDAMAFAGFITNPDAEVFLRRIINKPARGLGPTSTGRVNANARKKNMSFIEELRSIMNDRIEIPEDGEGYKPAFVKKLKEFGFLVGQMRSDAHAASNAGEAIRAILERSGYLPNMRRDALRSAGLKDVDFDNLPPREFLTALIRETSSKREQVGEDISSEDLADRAGQLSEASRRIGNIALLLEQAEPHASLEAFMQEATLEMDQSEQAAGIQVMTVHASKGLEFSKVRLPFWMEGIFPHGRALEEGDAAIEEERRLAYVALTRAIDDVRISRSWKIYGCPFIRGRTDRPSRFIDEMRLSPNNAFKMTSIKGANNAVYKVGPVKPVSRPAAQKAPAAPSGNDALKLPPRQELAGLLGTRSPAAPAPAAAVQDSFFDQGFAPEQMLPPERALPEDPDDRPFAPVSEEEFAQMQQGEPDFGDMVPDYDWEPPYHEDPRDNPDFEPSM